MVLSVPRVRCFDDTQVQFLDAGGALCLGIGAGPGGRVWWLERAQAHHGPCLGAGTARELGIEVEVSYGDFKG
jgi:hypothetical protein